MKVLFVCRGNVGRSQIAEAVFNQLAPSGYKATSVGTKVFDKDGNSKEGERLVDRVGAEPVLVVLREIGIEAGIAVRNQITQMAVDESDSVVVMAEEETWPEYLIGNEKVKYWEIIDPKDKSLDDIRTIRDQITGLVKKLIEEIS